MKKSELKAIIGEDGVEMALELYELMDPVERSSKKNLAGYFISAYKEGWLQDRIKAKRLQKEAAEIVPLRFKAMQKLEAYLSTNYHTRAIATPAALILTPNGASTDTWEAKYKSDSFKDDLETCLALRQLLSDPQVLLILEEVR